MDFIIIEPMVPKKIKSLTLKHGLLWNMIILKSESPYNAFTLLHIKP
jgi:hypothetical protein